MMGMATASQWLFNFVVAKATPSMFATLGANGFGTYFVYGTFCFVMVVFAWFFVPETSGEWSFVNCWRVLLRVADTLRRNRPGADG